MTMTPYFPTWHKQSSHRYAMLCDVTWCLALFWFILEWYVITRIARQGKTG